MKIALPFRSLLLLLLLSLSLQGLQAQQSIALPVICAECPANAALGSSGSINVDTDLPACLISVNGTYTAGNALGAGNNIVITLQVNATGAYSLTTNSVNGFSFSGSGTFSGTGNQQVTLSGSGTPTASGVTGFVLQAGNTNCAFNVNVGGLAPNPPNLNPSNGALLTGTAEPNRTILIDVNGDGNPDYVTVSDGSGNFSQVLNPALPNGTVIAARARDGAGNTSSPASVTVDAQAPAAPVLNASNGSVLTGTAEPNSTVLIDVNGDNIPDFVTTADGSGNFSQPFSPALANGTVITARARDAAGNTSAPASVTVDAQAPAAPVLNASNGSVLTGTAEPNSTVLIDVNGDGTPDFTTTADGSGNFSQPFSPALANGTVIAARARDAAGNTSAPASVTVDAQAPAAPVLDPSDGTLISGTAEPGSTILIDVNNDGTPDYTTVADNNGNFSQAISPALAGGTLVSVVARDEAGNNSAPATLTTTAPPGLIASLNCAGATNNGSLTAGVAASGVSSSVPYTGGNGNAHSGQTVASTGVTGLTATLAAGSFANGAGNLIYTITGTPGASGTASFALNIGGQSCTLTRTVQSIESLPAGSGSFTGRTCFDIALSNDNTNNCAPLTSRTPRQDNFTLANINTQTYTFTPSGTVSNVRFVYSNTNGSVITNLAGGNSGNNISTAVTATVTYNNNLNTLALGLTNSNPLRATITVLYNDGATNNGTDRQLTLNAEVKDCACCGAATTTGGWQLFQCHNLGANTSVDPFTYSVGNADGSGGTLGHLYQWGRPADGHQLRNSVTTATLATSNTPGNNSFIITSASPFDWRSGAGNNARWGDGTQSANPAKAANDPCPPGWKVPSQSNWSSIYQGGTINGTPGAATANTWTWTGNGYKVGNSLYLPATGQRDYSIGILGGTGAIGYYWSSTVSGGNAFTLYFNSVNVSPALGNFRAYGNSVRCVPQ